MDPRTRHLLTAPPLPLLVRMATPNSIAFFVQSCVSLAEVWFVGRLGSAALASIALVFPLLMLTQTMSGGAMGGAVTSAVARALGAGDVQRAEALVWHALVLAAAGAVLFLLLFALGGAAFLSFLGGTGEVLAEAVRYGWMLVVGGLSVWLVGVVSAVFRGMGDMRFPALMMIVNACLQVPLSALLVLGGFGVPSLGVAGAALSAVVSASVIALIMLAVLRQGDRPVRLRTAVLRFERAHFSDLARVFLPASLSPLLTVTTIISLTAIVGRYGEEALAGYGIGSRVEFLIIPLVFGLGASMTSLVGMAVGAGDFDRAERVGWTGGAGAFVLAGCTGMVLALLPSYWIPVFSDTPEVVASATAYIRIVGPCYGFFGLGLALYFASQGAGAMRWPVIGTVVRVLLAVVGALMLSRGFGLDLHGVYYAAAAAMVVYGVIIAGSLKAGAWRRG